MANPEEIQTIFIDPLSAAFTSPPGANPERFFDLLGDNLVRFTPHQLETGAKALQINRTARTFPTIAECVSECSRMPESPRPPVRRMALDEHGQPVTQTALDKAREEAASRKHAEARCCCALGRKAADERWLPVLIEFVESHDRLPSSREAEGLRARSRGHDAAAREVPGAGGASLMRLRTIMHETCERRVFGEQQEAAQ